MDTKKFILRHTALLALGEGICVAAIIGIFAMLGHFDYTVALGGALGGLLAIGNFFFMAIASSIASDKAMKDDVKGGKDFMKASYRMRLVILALLLFVFAKSGHCNLIALGAPLVCVFPILTVIEFFRKAGESKV